MSENKADKCEHFSPQAWECDGVMYATWAYALCPFCNPEIVNEDIGVLPSAPLDVANPKLSDLRGIAELSKYPFGCYNAEHMIAEHMIDEIQALKAKLTLALEALELILPMAKGYAYNNQARSNLAYIESAQDAIKKIKGEA